MPITEPQSLAGRKVVVVETMLNGKVAFRDTFSKEPNLTPHPCDTVERDVWVWQYNENSELELKDRYSA